MNRLINRIARRLGIRGLDLDTNLTIADRDRMLRLSALPSVAITLLFVGLVMDIFFNTRTFDLQHLPDKWPTRIDTASSDAATLLSTIGTAVLFIGGASRVSRQLASWAAVFAGALLITATACAGFVIFTDLDTSAYSASSYDRFYSVTWEQLAEVAGISAIGYAFLAYRGLSGSHQPGSRIAERRRRDAA